MTGTTFAISAGLVFILHFAQASLFQGKIPIDCSLILALMVLRQTPLPRSLAYSFLLSLALDLVFLTQQVKGLNCMAILPLVYLGGQIRHLVIPAYAELAMFLYFILFFFLHYAVKAGLCALLGLPFQTIPFRNLLYWDLWHTLILGALLALTLRYGKVPT